MARFFKKSSKKPGDPPGTLFHVGKKRHDKVKIHVTVLDYDNESVKEKEVTDVEEIGAYLKSKTTTWINVDGIHDLERIQKVGEVVGLHPLVQEDIVNSEQRPKIEDYDNYLYIVLKMFVYDEKTKQVSAEQISLVVGDNYVVSFQEDPGDVFEPVRERIRNSKGRIRKMSADYLAYALMDSIVDYYFIVLEKIGEQIEDIEIELVSDPNPDTLQLIHSLKREAIYLRKSVWPLREVISSLQRGGFKLIRKDTEVFLRDLYDHTIQVIDTVETFRDMISGMLDIYMSSVSNKMNEVMKVLTIIATIFIPLTFIAGVYGMNFQNMPELYWQNGYFYTLALMAFIGFMMIMYFKRKDWL